MGLFDILRGERKPPPADLDALFAISTAAPTLTVNLGLRPSGCAGVCFKPVEMAQFDAVLADLDQLLAMDDAQPVSPRRVEDELGFAWLVLSCDDVPTLVVATHTVNRAIQDAGFGSQLLCSVFGFLAADGPVLLVYSYKRGRFYPFIPRGGRTRDGAAELRLRASLEHELPMEPELERWYPVWDAPVLQGSSPPA